MFGHINGIPCEFTVDSVINEKWKEEQYEDMKRHNEQLEKFLQKEINRLMKKAEEHELTRDYFQRLADNHEKDRANAQIVLDHLDEAVGMMEEKDVFFIPVELMDHLDIVIGSKKDE